VPWRLRARGYILRVVVVAAMAGEGWGEIFRLVERLALLPSHAAGAAGAFAGLRFVILETQHAHAVLDQVPAYSSPPTSVLCLRVSPAVASWLLVGARGSCYPRAACWW
jgi:hypothetical protein